MTSNHVKALTLMDELIAADSELHADKWHVLLSHCITCWPTPPGLDQVDQVLDMMRITVDKASEFESRLRSDPAVFNDNIFTLAILSFLVRICKLEVAPAKLSPMYDTLHESLNGIFQEALQKHRQQT